MSYVSVVMPLYNAERYVEGTINSILKQSYKNFEIIVVDDASTDKSALIVEKLSNQYNCIRLYKNEKNMGIAYTRNRAIELSKGDYVAIMDDDDLMPKYRLKEEVDFLDKYEEYDIVTGHAKTINEEGEDLHKNSYIFLNPNYLRAYLLLSNTLPSSATMIRKKFVNDTGIRYRNNMYGAEDYCFWVEASLKCRIGIIDKVMLYWRMSKNNQTSCVLSRYSQERKEVIRNIQKLALDGWGFYLSEEEYSIIYKIFAEEGCPENISDLKLLYGALQNISIQAKQLNLPHSEEIRIMCRKRFGEKVGKAFFLWTMS